VAFTEPFSGSPTVSTTERSFPAATNYTTPGVPPSPQTTAGEYYILIDVVTNMVAGDQVTITLYDKIAGAGNAAQPLVRATRSGKQSDQVVFGPVFLKDGWDVSGIFVLGGPRVLAFSVRSITQDVNVASFTAAAITAAAIASAALTAAKFATDALDANALAASAVTEIQTGLATSAALATVQADTDDIQTRLPAALIGGRVSADVGSWLGTVAATPTVAGVPKVEVASMGAGTIAAATFAAGAITSTVVAASAIGATQIGSAALTAAKFATDAIDANALATTAVTEIQTGLATSTALSTAQADLTTLTGRLTATRAGLLDNLDTTLSSRASLASVTAVGSAVAAVNTDTDDIQARLPAALVGGRISADIGSWLGTAAAVPTVAGVPKVEVSSVGTGTITSTTFAAGAITSTVIAAAAIGATQIGSAALTAAKFSTDAIDANALAATAVTEIQTGLATSTAVASVQAAIATVQSDTDDIQSRLPSTLDSGNMRAAVQALTPGALTAIADSIFNYVIEAAPLNATTFLQRLRVDWSVMMAQASGLTITVATTESFQDAANTKPRITFTLGTGGVRTPGTFDGT
jgi:hypothetical protein